MEWWLSASRAARSAACTMRTRGRARLPSASRGNSAAGPFARRDEPPSRSGRGLRPRGCGGPAAAGRGGGRARAPPSQAQHRLLFISGQTPVKLDGRVRDGFEAQCRLAWRNVEAQLAAAGMSLDNIVLHRTFLADRRYAMTNRLV